MFNKNMSKHLLPIVLTEKGFCHKVDSWLIMQITGANSGKYKKDLVKKYQILRKINQQIISVIVAYVGILKGVPVV